MGQSRPIEYTKTVNNAGTVYMAMRAFDYCFDKPRKMKPGDKVTPETSQEMEYCQQLAFNGALSEVAGE